MIPDPIPTIDDPEEFARLMMISFLEATPFLAVYPLISISCRKCHESIERGDPVEWEWDGMLWGAHPGSCPPEEERPSAWFLEMTGAAALGIMLGIILGTQWIGDVIQWVA